MTLLSCPAPSDDALLDRLRALRRAAATGEETTVRRLLDGLPRPLPLDEVGMSVLHVAVDSDHAGVIRALVEHGEDLNHPSSDGWTALMGATAAGRLFAVQALLDAGAALTPVDRGFGHSALHLAADHHQIGPALLLIAAGADLDLPDRQGRLPHELARPALASLMLAARMAHTRQALEGALPAGNGDHGPTGAKENPDASSLGRARL